MYLLYSYRVSDQKKKKTKDHCRPGFSEFSYLNDSIGESRGRVEIGTVQEGVVTAKPGEIFPLNNKTEQCA